MITNVYVDGFNLYYGALRKTPHRWLDLEKLCSLLLPNNTIGQIKYFTALVSARPNDPDQPVRQQTYLRALATELLYDAHLGKFDIAALITNDSDLLPPIKIVRGQLGKKIGLLNPQKKTSQALAKNADFIKQIRASAIAASQFPSTLHDAQGPFTKPVMW